MVAHESCASTSRNAKGAREESIPPIRQPERSGPTQVAASANRGESAANRKECSLSHTSPAPRVLGRPSRDLRTGVERRLRPSARFSRGRTLLAARDASHVSIEACGAPVSTDWTVSEGERKGAKRAFPGDWRTRRSAGWILHDRDIRRTECVTCPPQSNLRSKDLEGDQSPGRRGQRASATTVAGTSPSAEKSHGGEASRTLGSAR